MSWCIYLPPAFFFSPHLLIYFFGCGTPTVLMLFWHAMIAMKRLFLRASPRCPHAAECFVLMSCQKKRKKEKSFERETSQTAKISESIMVMRCTPFFLSLFKCLASESVMQTTCQFCSISSFAQHQFGLTSEETFPFTFFWFILYICLQVLRKEYAYPVYEHLQQTNSNVFSVY